MPLYAAGQRIRGSEINALPQLYRVASPQICNNSTAMRDVVGLTFQADVNGMYLIECFLACHASTSGDIKFGWVVPSGTLQNDVPTQYQGSWWSAQGVDASASGGRGSLDSRITATLTTSWERSGDGTYPVLICPVALAVIGATAGAVKLQFAQQNLAVHDTTVRQGSCMRVSRLA